MTKVSAVVPRGQVPLPPEVSEYLEQTYNVKGGFTAFCDRAGIKSDTLRLALKRGTTTQRTLQRLTKAIGKSGVPVLASTGTGRTETGRTELVRQPATPAVTGRSKNAAEPQVDRLPPAVLRQVQRVSSALIDGMQLMQLTMLKALQEELMEGRGPLGHMKMR